MAHKSESHRRGERDLRAAGYAHGGGIKDEEDDKGMVEKGVHEHEHAMHKGSPLTKLKLKRGGKVPGGECKERPDRRARGGAMGKKGSHKVIVNVNGQQGDPMREQMAHKAGLQQGMAIGARGAGAVPGGPPRPPMAPPMGGAPAGPMMPPGGAPPMAQPPPMMPPRPPMAGPPGGAPPMPMRRAGGAITRRDAAGRFTGGAI